MVEYAVDGKCAIYCVSGWETIVEYAIYGNCAVDYTSGRKTLW